MTFRVAQIALYNRAGNGRRELDFRTQGLNVVTGVSRRGKSAIASILDYLMLSRSCPIPRGVVRDHVSDVAGLFRRSDGSEMIVSRSVPEQGHSGSQVIHIQTGRGIHLPSQAIEGRWNLTTARDRLSEFAGIEHLPLLTDTSLGEDQYPPANIRHAAPFLFQPQDVIASRGASFPGLDDFWRKRHVLDAINYFLGVFSAEMLQVRRRLRELEAEERTARRRLAELRRLGAEGYDKGQRLHARAVALGIAPDGRAESLGDLHTLLAEALQNHDDTSAETVASSMLLDDAVEAERRARARFHNLEHRIALTRAEVGAARSHTDVVEGDLQRISLRSLLPAKEQSDCPLCGSDQLSASDLDSRLEAAADMLGHERIVPARLSSEVGEELARLQAEARVAASEMRTTQRQLRGLFEHLSEERTVLDELRARATLRGQIEAYLSATSDLADSEESDSSAVLEEIAALKDRLRDSAGLQDVTQTAVQVAATTIARELQVEFAESCRVNLEKLTIEVWADSRWVHLEEFGSAANWVGYHVSASLGLAEVLARRNAPVPQFLVLDQPSQAWFPPEATSDGPKLPDGADDRQAVERLYRVLSEHAALPSAPQIIVLDHAYPAADWFDDAVIADWHVDGRALVPSGWVG